MILNHTTFQLQDGSSLFIFSDSDQLNIFFHNHNTSWAKSSKEKELVSNIPSPLAKLCWIRIPKSIIYTYRALLTHSGLAEQWQYYFVAWFCMNVFSEEFLEKKPYQLINKFLSNWGQILHIAYIRWENTDDNDKSV